MFADTSSDPNTGVVTNSRRRVHPRKPDRRFAGEHRHTATKSTSRATITRTSTAKSPPATRLAMSLNNATVRLAQEVGFDKVAALAKAAGITSVRATPAIALGAYDATPLEMAGAYTVFANGGSRLSPHDGASRCATPGATCSTTIAATARQVLDPRVAYVMTTMMEAVINSGTGYPVRARGFDRSCRRQDRHLARRLVRRIHQQSAVHRLGGQRRLHRYQARRRRGGGAHLGRVHEARRQVAAVLGHKGFSAPSGVVTGAAGQGDEPAGDAVVSRRTYTVAFIAGTEPKETCDQASGDHRGFFTKIFGLGSPPVAAPPPTTNGPVQSADGNPPTQASPNGDPAQAQQASSRKKKKGFFSRLFGKGDSGDEQQNSGANTAENGNNPSPK